MRQLRLLWIGLLCVWVSMVAAQDDVHVFFDGTEITIPSGWDVDFADADLLTLVKDDHEAGFRLYSVYDVNQLEDSAPQTVIADYIPEEYIASDTRTDADDPNLTRHTYVANLDGGAQAGVEVFLTDLGVGSYLIAYVYNPATDTPDESLVSEIDAVMRDVRVATGTYTVEFGNAVSVTYDLNLAPQRVGRNVVTLLDSATDTFFSVRTLYPTVVAHYDLTTPEAVISYWDGDGYIIESIDEESANGNTWYGVRGTYTDDNTTYARLHLITFTDNGVLLLSANPFNEDAFADEDFATETLVTLADSIELGDIITDTYEFSDGSTLTYPTYTIPNIVDDWVTPSLGRDLVSVLYLRPDDMDNITTEADAIAQYDEWNNFISVDEISEPSATAEIDGVTFQVLPFAGTDDQDNAFTGFAYVSFMESGGAYVVAIEPFLPELEVVDPELNLSFLEFDFAD